MLLTITYSGKPATDLGYLLHKNPYRFHSFDLPFGQACVFYPETTEERCTAALLLNINPVDLARGFRNSSEKPLFEYVNDRPYVASSFMSVAIAKVFGTALSGRSKERQDLADQALPLQARLTTLPAHGGADVIRRLFEPLGYEVNTQGYPLDEKFPSWGQSCYYTVSLTAHCRLAELLNHIYVLIPVLDEQKHYWIGEDEIDKLLRHGEGWLASHPEKELITSRYLKRRRSLVNEALNRLLVMEEPVWEEVESSQTEKPDVNLNEQRLDTVTSVLKDLGAKRVLDMGCGEGKLLGLLLREKDVQDLAGMDVAHRVLQRARERLRLDDLPPMQRERITLFQSSLIYRDKRFQGYDAVTVIEVIEHLDLSRLAAFERVLFEFTRPPAAIITTPNREYNVKFSGLSGFRHKDHRFEWTRDEFQTWAHRMCARYGYKIRFVSIGDEDPVLGAPTQMGVFTL